MYVYEYIFIIYIKYSKINFLIMIYFLRSEIDVVGRR